MRLVVGVEHALPAPLHPLALFLRVPALPHAVGNLEGRVSPADRLARGGDFLVAQRRTMRAAGIGLGRRAFADDGLGADQRRPAALTLRFAQRAVHRLDVVAVHGGDHLPAIGLEAAAHVVGVPLLDAALVRVDRDAVVVVDGDQLAQAERAGKRAGFVGNTFHHAAVAEEGVGEVIDQFVARPVELRRQQPFGDRHADRVGNTLPERAGGGLDAGREAVLRMARRLRAELAEALQLRHRQVVAGQVQQRVQQHRAVPVGEHEAVAVRPGRIAGVVREVAVPERHRDLGHAHRHAGVAGIRRLHRVHGQRAQRICHFVFRCRRNHFRGCKKNEIKDRRAANYIGATFYNRPMNEMPFTSPADFSAGVASQSPTERAYWFVFQADRLLVELGPPSPHPSGDPRAPSRASWAKLPLLKNNNWLWFEPARTLYLGRLAGTDCWAAEAPREAEAPPPGMGWEGLRALFSVLEDAHFAGAGRAIQLLDWDRSHRFCGRCGTPTEAKTEERSRVCPACKLAAYPRLSPAV